MDELTTVEVKVTPILREFIMSVHKSDTIRVTKNDLIGSKVKYILQLPPKDYKPSRDFTDTIKIELLNFNIGDRRVYTEHRNYLDTRGQLIIYNELNKTFKEIFHNYVLAYVRGNDCCDGSQKNGILDFCDVYNLPMDRVNYEMLKKSWDRSKQKAMLKEKNFFKKNN